MAGGFHATDASTYFSYLKVGQEMKERLEIRKYRYTLAKLVCICIQIDFHGTVAVKNSTFCYTEDQHRTIKIKTCIVTFFFSKLPFEMSVLYHANWQIANSTSKQKAF